MNKKFPIHDYPIVAPVLTPWLGLDILAQHWERTISYSDKDPGSNEFQEYLFWRQSLVIWTCCNIEALVNLEGATWLGTKFYLNTFERNRTTEKIRILYAIKYQEPLDNENEILRNLQSIFELRNQFIHPKSRSESKTESNKSQKYQDFMNLHPTEFKNLVIEVNSLLGMSSE